MALRINRATVQALCSSTAGLRSFQVSLGQELYSEIGEVINQLPCLDRVTKHIPGPARLIVCSFKSGRPAPCQFPGQNWPPFLVLQINRTTGQDFYLGTQCAKIQALNPSGPSNQRLTTTGVARCSPWALFFSLEKLQAWGQSALDAVICRPG